MHSVPATEGLLKETQLPFAVALSPLHDPQSEAEECPVVPAARPPARCNRCRAYLSPFSTFGQNGKAWVCDFCGMINEVSQEFFCNLDTNNVRLDVREKPELCRGSVEYDVDGLEQYAPRIESNNESTMQRVVPMHHLFCIDISRSTASVLPSLVTALKITLAEMGQHYPMCSVSFITYAETLQFYDFSAASAFPQLIVCDTNEPFVPLPFASLCWLKVGQDQEKIMAFLDRLTPDDVDEEGSAMGAAAKVASMILGSTGGKVIFTVSGIPNVGVGQLKPREFHKLYGKDKEQQLFQPIPGFWRDMGLELAKKQIVCDIIAFPQKYCELITIGSCAHVTGGSQSLFANFNPEMDSHRLQNVLNRACLESAGYCAIIRLRCSQGLLVKGYHGHFVSNDPSDMDCAGITSSSSFVADLIHESQIDPKSHCYMQCAMLYTTRCGHRRVRVHTLKVPVSNQHVSTFRLTDLEPTVLTLLFHSVKQAMNNGTQHGRKWLQDAITKVLVAYRKHCSNSSNTGQLLLPEQLKLITLFGLCATKSDALSQGTSVPLDDRVQSMYDLLTMPLGKVLSYLYPVLYHLHGLLSHPFAGLPKYEGHASPVFLPPLQQGTCEYIYTHGVYMLQDAQANNIYLWIGSDVSERVCQDLFGVAHPSSVSTAGYEGWHERLQAIVAQVIQETQGRLVLMHEKNHPLEDAFFNALVEDERDAQAKDSYSEFLCGVHKTINAKLS